MSDELEHEIIRQMAVIESKQDIMIADLAVVKSKSHTTSECSLARQVNDLKLAEARRNGIFAVIGIVAVAATTFVFNAALRYLFE